MSALPSGRLGVLALVCASVVWLCSCSSTPRAQRELTELEKVTQFNVRPIKYNFKPPSNWELDQAGWEERSSAWSSAFCGELSMSTGRPVIELSPGVDVVDGAYIEYTVTEVTRGHYAFVHNEAGSVRGTVKIIDCKTGKIIEQRTIAAQTPDGNKNDWYSYEGRVKRAHMAAAHKVVGWIGNRVPKPDKR